jgi:hypothetical protein
MSMTRYHVVVEGENGFTADFDGEPQINLTFDHDGQVYRVVTRAHDEQAETATLHAVRI